MKKALEVIAVIAVVALAAWIGLQMPSGGNNAAQPGIASGTTEVGSNPVILPLPTDTVTVTTPAVISGPASDPVLASPPVQQ